MFAFAFHPLSRLSDVVQIKDIQECLEHDNFGDGDEVPSTATDEPEVILSNSKPLTLDDVRASLPSRPVADRLLSVHFNAKYLHIRKTCESIHCVSFYSQ